MKQTDGLWSRSPEPKQFWLIAAGAEVKNFYMVKPEPEIWVTVTQPKFVWQAS